MLGVEAWYFSTTQGYIVFTNGLIIQWIRNTSGAGITFNFPVAFSEIPIVLKGSVGNSETSLQWGTYADLGVTSLSKTAAVCGGGSVYSGMSMFAIGY